jgi:shikimate kinase
MQYNVNVAFIGFMGVGKTSVGSLLAKKLGYTFMDSDILIQNREGKSIEEIFSSFGEAYFRSLENKIITEISYQENTVIATGGGIVLNPDNIKTLKSTSVIVLLKAHPKTILRNLLNDSSNDSQRPLLKDCDVLKKIEDLINKRTELYNCYDYVINIDHLNIEQVVEKTINNLSIVLPKRFSYITA